MNASVQESLLTKLACVNPGDWGRLPLLLSAIWELTQEGSKGLHMHSLFLHCLQWATLRRNVSMMIFGRYQQIIKY